MKGIPIGPWARCGPSCERGICPTYFVSKCRSISRCSNPYSGKPVSVQPNSSFSFLPSPFHSFRRVKPSSPPTIPQTHGPGRPGRHSKWRIGLERGIYFRCFARLTAIRQHHDASIAIRRPVRSWEFGKKISIEIRYLTCRLIGATNR